MKSWQRRLLGVGAVLALAAGCSSPGEDAQGTGVASVSPVIAPFQATVELSNFSATCREVACWLPTQFEPTLRSGETVSLHDEWPMDGMTVLVLCETSGGSYRDEAGQDTTAWYGILVPGDKLEPGADQRAANAEGRDGWIGYVGAAWITGGQDKQAPSC